MNIFKSLFKTKTSNRPEDYSKIYFRWDREGKEYGPLWFDDMITRKWSGPPLEGRFENESKWKPYSYFQKILSNLQISNEQISLMEKLGMSNINSELSFVDAVNNIQKRNEELSLQREKEREEKEKLPATKQTRKKLIDLGIEFDDNITRREAKELIGYYKDKEYLKEIFEFFKKNNITFVESLSVDAILKGVDDDLPSFDQLDEFYTTFESLDNTELHFDLPKKMNKADLEKLINQMYEAETDAEDVIEQLKERELFVGPVEYKVVGKLPEKQLKKIYTFVFNKYLANDWDIDRDLGDAIKTFLPEIRLKEIKY